MARMVFGFGATVLAVFLLAGSLSPAAAQNTDRSGRRYVAEQPPRIVIHPRRHQLSPDAVRRCVSWLAPQKWPNGETVITPQMRCWWED